MIAADDRSQDSVNPDDAAQRCDVSNAARLVVSGPTDAAMNMAIDQALLESVDSGSDPCLRFYQWSGPTLSLGYFQSITDAQQYLDGLADKGIVDDSEQVQIVRRASGGGAILHDHELTYSIALGNCRIPGRSQTQLGASDWLYQSVHNAIAVCLGQFQCDAARFRDSEKSRVLSSQTNAEPSFLCFQRRTENDLITSGYKVLGSAQRRGRRSILQHGSLLIRASAFAPVLPGVQDLGGAIPGRLQLISSLAECLSRSLGIALIDSELSDRELDRAEDLSKSRFGASDWTNRR